MHSQPSFDWFKSSEAPSVGQTSDKEASSSRFAPCGPTLELIRTFRVVSTSLRVLLPLLDISPRRRHLERVPTPQRGRLPRAPASARSRCLSGEPNKQGGR